MLDEEVQCMICTAYCTGDTFNNKYQVYVVKITGLIIFGLGRDYRLGQNCVRNLISFNLKG